MFEILTTLSDRQSVSGSISSTPVRTSPCLGEFDQGVLDERDIAVLTAFLRICQKEHLYFLYLSQHDFDGLHVVHQFLASCHCLINLGVARLAILIL